MIPAAPDVSRTMVTQVTAFDSLAQLLRDRVGLVIGSDKLYLLETRLTFLMRREGLPGLDDLAQAIRLEGESGKLADDVVEAMTTNETSFFRDYRPFKHLERHGLPRQFQARPAGQPLRIWSAAASSGQEAYSIAMLVEESQLASPGSGAVIIGTDIARGPLAQAQQGSYTQLQVQRGLSDDRLQRHFVAAEDRWHIRESLRSICQFQIWNLLDDLTPLGQFDIIFCRNVLMYFDAATKTRVLAKVAAQLRPGGLLYLGGPDTAIDIGPRLKPFQQQRAIYESAQAAT